MSETLTQSLTTNHDIVNLAAASLSAAPDLSDSERTSRFQTVIRGTLEFHPADATQTMLASLILGHHLTIMDGFRDIACLKLNPTEAARARMVTVAQTKLILQMIRELRIARAAAPDQTATRGRVAEPGVPSAVPAGDSARETSMTKFMSAYTDTLATLESRDTLTPAFAATMREALGQAIEATPLVTPREASPVAAPVTGSRAQRRALMKRQGQFKRTA